MRSLLNILVLSIDGGDKRYYWFLDIRYVLYIFICVVSIRLKVSSGLWLHH